MGLGVLRSRDTSAYSYFMMMMMMMVVAYVSQAQGQVTIITQPMNVTVCLSQSTTANFTCVVDGGSTGITSVGWQILTGGFYAAVVGRDRHMLDPRTSINNTGTIVTETLTVTDVSLSDNGAKYRCEPVLDVISDVVTLTVIAAPPAITGVEVNEKCTNDFTVSWTPASNEEGLSYVVTLISQSGVIFVDSTMNTSYTFTGLTPNTDYSVFIVSVLNSCSGTHNAIIVTAVTVEAGVPQSISNLKNESRTNATITIVWDPADSPNCGPVLNYNVTIVNSVNGTEMSTTTLNDTRLEIFNLMSGTAYNITVAAVNRAGTGLTSTVTVTTRTDEEEEVATRTSYMDDSEDNSSLSTGVVAVITAVSSCMVSIVITAIITFVITAHYYKRKYNKQTAAVTQPIVSRTGTIEYEEITKTSVPDNPTYDVAMTSNPAYGQNVKKIDQVSDYYN